MNTLGISDSVRMPSNVAACAKCGSTSRVGRGFCLNCLLQSGLETDTDSTETLDEVLAAVDVRDTEWRLGNYQILEEIGRGGMGVIYRARQRHSRRIVAVKRVLGYHSDSRETLARFRREAQAAASLDHPNILPIYEVSESEDALPFFSMKFAPGGSLQEVGPALRNDPRQCVALVAKIARAVQHAHSKGILHRDLKPGNILLDGSGEPLVSDFGLAKWLDTTSDLTRTLTIFGTPGYIAPEQASGAAAQLKPGADVYSLGAILFDLLAGRPPFLGAHALSVIRQAAETPAPKLRTLSKVADRDLETICSRCLEREPKLRYPSAHDLAEDLERWLEGRPIIARPISPPVKLWRWSRRNPIVASAIVIGILIIGTMTVREIGRRNLENVVQRGQLALRSVAVLPLLNLDTIEPESNLSARLGASLQKNLNLTGPAKVTSPFDASEGFVAATVSQLKEISGKYSVRTALVGTVHQVNGKSRISLQLWDAADGRLLAQRTALLQSPNDSLTEILNPLLRALTQRSGNSSEHRDRDDDPGLQNTTARDLIVTGRALADRRNGQDLDRAIACFEKAIAAEPQSSVAHAHLALTCLGQATLRFDPALLRKAEAAANEAIRLAPNRSEAHRAMAMVLEKKGDFEAAQTEIFRAIETDGMQERLASHLGAIALLMGRPDRTLRWCRIASQWQTRPAMYEHLIGDCFTELGLDEEAEAAYKRVADLQPDMPESWMGLCRLRLLQGETRAARDIWLANQAHYEAFDFARQMGAQVEFFTRHYSEAKTIYKTLVETAPDGGAEFFGAMSYKSALGRLLQLTGENEQAAELLTARLSSLRQRLEPAPRDPNILYELAAIESSLDLSGPALEHLQAAVGYGWLDYRSTVIDPRFDNIRFHIQFRKAIEAMRQKVALLREGVSRK